MSSRVKGQDVVRGQRQWTAVRRPVCRGGVAEGAAVEADAGPPISPRHAARVCSRQAVYSRRKVPLRDASLPPAEE